jgi:hypothetical protein
MDPEPDGRFVAPLSHKTISMQAVLQQRPWASVFPV